jgi:predicted nucleotide-binding protein
LSEKHRDSSSHVEMLLVEAPVASKFKGSIEALKSLIESAGVTGKWFEKGEGRYTFKSEDGGILNWWMSTGTIQFQGDDTAKAVLEKAVMRPVSQIPAAAILVQPTQQIFIVHGHDTDARDQLELALHRLGLEPFVLMNSSGGGKTIIEALEGKIGRDYSSDFGIVLMTPDDIGYAKKGGPEKAEPRARQNVILETGMLLSSLTRARMAIVIKGHIEIPSDLEGIIRFGYNDHVKEIVPKLCQRLREAGFEIDPDQIAAAAQ